MNDHEYIIIDQTIQPFPRLILGKHGLPRASRMLMKPSDKTSKTTALVVKLDPE